MAKLTRTQKFADLREQLANDREVSMATEELKAYEDKLKSVKSYLNDNAPNEEILKKQEPVYQNINPVEEPFNNISQMDNPFSGEGIQIETPDIDVSSMVSDPYYDKPSQTVEEVVSKPMAEFDTPNTISGGDENIDDIVSMLEKDFNSLNGNVEPVEQPKAPIFEQNQFVEQPKEPMVEQNQFVEQPSESQVAPQTEMPRVDEQPQTNFFNTKTVNDNYLSEAIEQVKEYNRQDGRQTIDEIPNNLITDIRRSEETNKIENDAFSNTVTLELDKVLQEISNTQELKLKEVQEQVKVQEEKKPVEIKPEPKPVQMKSTVIPQTPISQPKQETVVEPKVVEIKSMEETIKQDIIDDTIPFKMSENEDVISEDEEDEGPNKVLNIILLVLIIVLVLILLVIVYYILLAKGILS